MKIYTKTGDAGETSLFGGQRVSKDHLRIRTYGTVDELNSIIGLALSEIDDKELTAALVSIQHSLFTLGSDLATPKEKDGKVKVPRVESEHADEFEKMIDSFSAKLPELRSFILPGGSKGASYLHFARTVCRRAEREVVALTNEVDIGDNILIYLNRLSDLLFVLARYANLVTDTPDVKWQK